MLIALGAFAFKVPRERGSRTFKLSVVCSLKPRARTWYHDGDESNARRLQVNLGKGRRRLCLCAKELNQLMKVKQTAVETY